ncbi:MAG TPA: four helix bundle protein [Burkholderiales bacterium]|jgi:four helix bundle protein|nr:four helix bundle protein [Burkholderiales bacterium]
MSGVRRFEDLVAWQKARELNREIYTATTTKAFSRDFSLINQVRSAAASIMSNIAEGFERGGAAEFHQYLVVAKASCGEVRSQLYLALDVGYLDEKDFRYLHGMAENVGKIIGALRVAVQRRRDAKR